MDDMKLETLKVRIEGDVCRAQFFRPEHNNTINNKMIDEWLVLLSVVSEKRCSVLVIEGGGDIFCYGADFSSLTEESRSDEEIRHDPEKLFDVWRGLCEAPFTVISLVKGKANAGGLGFVGASDIVIAEKTAMFSLSEMLFGLIPACVLPFLIRRIGFQKAHYLTLMTQPINAEKALSWGLVDVCEENSDAALRKHLLPLRRLRCKSIGRYKKYVSGISSVDEMTKKMAIDTNKLVFSDAENMQGIKRYVENGIFPWE